MDIFGLATTSAGKAYLSDVYKADFVSGSPVPVFTDGTEYFIGGLKGINTLLTDVNEQEINKLVDNAHGIYRTLTCNFSSPVSPYSYRRVDHVLDLRGWESEGRVQHYSKKKRNQVRKAHTSTLRCELIYPGEQFFDLYQKQIIRLHSIPKSSIWFETFLNYFRESVYCFGVYDKETLVAANLAIHSDGYLLLMFNVSNPLYWSLNVNDLLYDWLIEWSLEHKVQILDLGPSVKSDTHHTHFKEGFGAIPYPICDLQYGPMYRKLTSFLSEKKRNFTLRLRKFTTPAS